MAEHKYVLTYFDISGRGELSRLLFTYAGVPFEDVRIHWGEWDSKVDAYKPYGRLPILEIDGKVKLTQSLAIARYLARQFGLEGSTPLQRALADSVVETANELFNDLMTILWQGFKDDDIALQSAGTFLVSEGPRLLNHIEAIYEASGGPFVVGKELTWADLALVDISTKVKLIYGHFDFVHPKLKELIDRISASKPQLTEYLDKREADKIEELEDWGRKRIASGLAPGMFGVIYDPPSK